MVDCCTYADTHIKYIVLILLYYGESPQTATQDGHIWIKYYNLYLIYIYIYYIHILYTHRTFSITLFERHSFGRPGRDVPFGDRIIKHYCWLHYL